MNANSRPLFSIIIPAYNVGKMVVDAIESCLNQDGVDQSEIEILVINDGSSDDTLSFISRYEDVANVVIINQRNGGLSNARNNGMAAAKGEYILFLDGDDWLMPDALATLKPLAEPDVVVQFPLIYWYSETEQELNSCGVPPGEYSARQFMSLTLGQSKFQEIPAQKKLYPAGVLRDNKLRFVEGIYHEDNPFYVDVLMNAGRVKYINEGIYCYRQNRQGSITATRGIRNFEGSIQGNEYIIGRYGLTNRDIVHLLSNVYAFQMVGDFANKEHFDATISFFRRKEIKARLLKMFFSTRWRVKSQIRLLLLMIDPKLLWLVLRAI